MLRLFLAVCCVASVMTQPAGAQALLNRDSWRPSFENDPQGGVLCVWSIYISIQRIGAVCFPEETAFQTALDETVRRMDDFIIANMPTTREVLDAARRDSLRMSGTDEIVPQRCRGSDRRARDMLNMYRHSRMSGADSMRAEVDRLLATPRRPSMNPCL